MENIEIHTTFTNVPVGHKFYFPGNGNWYTKTDAKHAVFINPEYSLDYYTIEDPLDFVVQYDKDAQR